ncbi:heat shock factor protein 5 isoform X2 [Clinocottus analis]|uniref:heat shock factor protein 5 isoform X2 n=1 Tax=Clinocottus analis TaxID=304258 RepID=UPI0035BFA82E
MFGDTGKTMYLGGSPLPETINPNNFPAKLWRLVNNPANIAIRWNKQGQVIVIDQHLFEEQILSVNSSTSDNIDAFKTTNFSSFVRQLNLYGFKKADMTAKDDGHDDLDGVQYHYFHNPNFMRNRPELVASLKRLTVQNKAMIQAGLDVKKRPPSRFLRYSDDGSNKDVIRGSDSKMTPPHPYHGNSAQARTAHNGTPVPPRFLRRGQGAALSASTFVTEKVTPVSFSQHYATGAASSSNAMNIQQGLLACAGSGNPNFTFNAQYQPGFYSPLCQCYHPNLVASQMAGRGLPTGSFSTLSYYQIADEVMQTPPNSSLVRVVTPQKSGPVFVPFSTNTPLCDNPAGIVKSNHLSTGPVVMSVTGRADLVAFQQQKESVVLLAEQLPEDAICKVTVDDAKDTEVKGVEANGSEGQQSGQEQHMHMEHTQSLHTLLNI